MDLTISSTGISTNRLIAMATGGLAAQRRFSTSTENQQVEQSTSSQPFGKSELTEEEKRQVDQLKTQDAETRRHEQAHKAAAGAYAKGGATYEYQTGPDGKQYAVSGEVQIDVSPVEGDLDATIEKMKQVQRAARAPAEPSATDRRVAAKAAMIERRARTEKAQQESSDSREQESQDESVNPAASGEQHGGSFAVSTAGWTDGNASTTPTNTDKATTTNDRVDGATNSTQAITSSYGPSGIAALEASPRESDFAVLETTSAKTNHAGTFLSLADLFETSYSSAPGRFIDVRV